MPIVDRAGGNVDIFLKITGQKQGVIKGESQDQKHKDEIEVESFSWEVNQPADTHGGGMATGKRVHSPFRYVIRTSAATPKLFQAVVTGEHLKEVVLVCRKAGKDQQEYLKWTLGTAMITHLKSGVGEHGQLTSVDDLSLAFQTIEIEYKVQKPDGTLGGSIMAKDVLAVR